MTRTRVKVCGITTPGDAGHAVAAGADAIGLVFYSNSPRHLSIPAAREITLAMPPFTSTVGLFVNSSYQDVSTVLADVPLDLLQFHGDEDESFCSSWHIECNLSGQRLCHLFHGQLHPVLLNPCPGI